MVTTVPRQLPHLQQQLVSDKDRQIALLKQELNVQKRMLEVEREDIVREQDMVLTVEMEMLR